ncbi:hypothetical protein EMQ25_07390 [Arsenicitalea aurantiaca]|uniref:Fatty acid hydroxylase domain-containing protein n=1 Tax=Arsenicitalea aurantiaca TaxID=1783274 RepID=A0A433XG70_9HYPH|nr:sterol desaturase family protein [Arsenicitalea aurantiaca]RUT32948.1 hypothetical protein EMQ25_07390 [Arsenicitalea aurantiaca]
MMDILQDLTVWTILSWLLQGAVVFVISTFIFDVVHWALHKWAKSSNPMLRMFSGWHNVHHKFLDEKMNINPQWVKANFWAHLVPEFGTSVFGTVIFYAFFHWLPVTVILVIHVWMFIGRIKEEGIDYNHMAMDRVGGQRGFFGVDPNYHALHHIHPDQYYSSYVNVFDLVFGTNCKIKKRRFLVTGANGAFGSAMVKRLEKMGAIVETAKSGVDYGPDDYERMREKLERTDVLVLAHGAKSEDCWNANYHSFIAMIDMFTEIGKGRLTAPEVWALGSEIELHGDFGQDELKDYCVTKRAFAAHALGYYKSDALHYRHIVPSAFTSAMGKGMMSAETAVSIAMFFIKRGFTYVPVTLTTLAYWNYFRFLFQKPSATPPSTDSAVPAA